VRELRGLELSPSSDVFSFLSVLGPVLRAPSPLFCFSAPML
jgi:hypothetical protein